MSIKSLNDYNRKKRLQEAKTTRNKKRQRRVARIAEVLTERQEKIRDRDPRNRTVFKRSKPASKPKIKRIVAYDFETTKIAKGTPHLRYLTAYSGYKDKPFWFSGPVRSPAQLAIVLRNRFLTEDNVGVRFVAWNANNFDAYFMSAAVLMCDEFLIKPHLTKSNSLRGFTIVSKENQKHIWEFSDACAMLGMVGRKLSWFLRTFAPDHLKLDAPDWENVEFDAKNKKHVDYAERDSVGLWHGLMKSADVVMENFGVDLAGTVGGMAIKIFQHHIPQKTIIRESSKSVTDVVRKYVMRGGFCEYAKKYHGEVWKYDLNQAYAAAMRECDLPAGNCYHIDRYSPIPKCAIWKVTGFKESNKIPFYYREINGDYNFAIFANDEIGETWLTSVEVRQLFAEGWRLNIIEGYWWDDDFRMTEYVNKLESLRIDDPNSAQGIMIKYVGNNSYGKTVERLEGIDMLLSKEKPEGYSEYQNFDDPIQHLWFRFEEVEKRAYHQPQIGAFITAHVRMQVRRAALQAPDHWIYADTDCVVFSKPVELDIDKARYGAWKIEAEKQWHYIIEKKVYCSYDPQKIEVEEIPGKDGILSKHAKGLNIKRLSLSVFREWYETGIPPKQIQVQRNSYVKVMTGDEMFREQLRTGTRPKDQRKSNQRSAA